MDEFFLFDDCIHLMYKRLIYNPCFWSVIRKFIHPLSVCVLFFKWKFRNLFFFSFSHRGDSYFFKCCLWSNCEYSYTEMLHDWLPGKLKEVKKYVVELSGTRIHKTHIMQIITVIRCGFYLAKDKKFVIIKNNNRRHLRPRCTQVGPVHFALSKKEVTPATCN